MHNTSTCICTCCVTVTMLKCCAGLSEDNDDVCEDITSENFNFCFNLCINNTFNTVDICVSV